MMLQRVQPLLAAVALLGLFSAATAQKHEELGRMWTFESAPLDWFEEAYGFRPDEKWFEHLRLSSLRFGRGCSASFVSPRGLIVTNNHCAQEHVGKVTPADQDWIVNGFFAKELEQEVPIPDLTVQQLVAQRDVTAEMNEGITDDMTATDRQNRLRENRIALIEAAKEADRDHTHELVTLYQGGMFQIYSYKIYRDIRLVCAPQVAVAEFGGDPDNFTYPRYCLDFALVRAWEDGKPADTNAHYLRWKTEGPKEGDAVFVTGHPGRTGRLNTMAQMEYLRDVQYPMLLSRLETQLSRVREMTSNNPEMAKNMRPQLLMIENAKKAYTGYLDGLNNPRIMAIKREAEQRIREAIAADPELEARFGDAWERLEKIVADKRAAAEGGDRVGVEPRQEERDALKTIGEATFAVYGTEIPPDATFTLRISDGVVKGYPYNGTIAPWRTTLYGMFARSAAFGNAKPFRIPDNWREAEGELDLATPFDFVTTCDITGGNSGSPLVDTEGRFVGLVFDGNIQSLGNQFIFTDEVARTICVHPAIIIESLRKIYDSAALADELEGVNDR